jgi:hypothetical protein
MDCLFRPRWDSIDIGRSNPSVKTLGYRQTEKIGSASQRWIEDPQMISGL